MRAVKFYNTLKIFRMKSLFFDIGTINICSKFTTEKTLSKPPKNEK